MVKKYIILFIVMFFLSACAHGPVYTAKINQTQLRKITITVDFRRFIIRIRVF